MLVTIPELLELMRSLPVNDTVLPFYANMENEIPSEADWYYFIRRIRDSLTGNQCFVISCHGIGFLEILQDDKCELFIEEEFEEVTLNQLEKIFRRYNWGMFACLEESLIETAYANSTLRGSSLSYREVPKNMMLHILQGHLNS